MSGLLGDFLLGEGVLGDGDEISSSVIAVDFIATAEVVYTPDFTLDGIILAGFVSSGEQVFTPQFIKISGVMRPIETREFIWTPMFIKDEALGRVYVNGTPLPLGPKVSTMKIRRQLSMPHTASFDFWDPDQTLDVAEGSEVAIYWRGHRLFGGFVTSFSYKSHHATVGHEVSVECEGYTFLLARRFVYGKYDPATLLEYHHSLRGIAGDLHYRFFYKTGENIFFNQYDFPEVSIDELVEYNWVTMLDAMNDLARRTGTEWYTDSFGNLKGSRNSYLAAPFDLTDDDNKWADMRVKRTVSEQINTVIVKTNSVLAGTRTETFNGDGTIYQAFELQSRILVNDVPIVKVNGIQQVIVSEAGPEPGYQFSFVPGLNTVFPRTTPPVNVPFSLSDEIEITYAVEGLNTVTVKDDAAIAALKLISGGSGVREIIVDVGDQISDYASAVAYGEAYLQRRKIPNLVVNYKANEKFLGYTLDELMALEIGQTQTINTTQPTLNASFIIDTIEIGDIDGRLLEWSITGSNQKVREFWDRKLADLLKKATPQSNALDVYGFALAEDIPGSEDDNPGLIVNLFPVMQRPIRRDSILQNATLIGKDAQDSGQVRVDILLNGLSILDSPIIYLAANEGDPVTVSLKGRAVTQYDKLSVQVLEKGVGTPKNFNLEIAAVPTGPNQNRGFI